MGEENNKSQNGKQPRRFDQQQYKMLKRCSDKKDMTEWNEWRRQNPNEAILLDGGNFHGCYLSGAFLNTGAVVINPGTCLHEQWIFRGQVYLRGTLFLQAKLRGTDFRGTHLEETNLNFADLECGCLELAYLKEASLLGANLQSANLTGAKLQGADFSRAIVDGGTLIWQCEVDRKTKFEGVGLDAARLYPELKQLLEYNIRRKNWEEWYKEHPKLKYIVRPFWLMSDYGLSTGRIVAVFLGVALVFANIYYHWGRIAPPGIVDNLFVGRNGVVVPWWLVPLRAFYFAIITMTLGFSDMYANAQSIFGHILITVQALLGYVLLGALVTRFAILFAAGGPAGRFAKKTKATEDTEKNGSPPIRLALRAGLARE